MTEATIKTTGPIRGPAALTPEWHAAHRTCMTASRAAAACGLSRWEQPLDVYLQMRGLVPPKEETPAMRMGLALEPVIGGEYTLRTGVELLRPMPMFFSSVHPHIGATPDGESCTSDPYLVELKSSSFRRAAEWGEEGTDEVPDDYVCQVQHQMFVMQRERCDLAVLLDGRTLRIYTIRRSEKMIASMVKLETELWERIVAGDPPPPDYKHPGTLDLLKRLHGVKEGSAVALSEDAVDFWIRSRNIGEQIKQMEADRDEAKARVIHELGDHAIGLLPDGKEVVRSVVHRKAYSVAECEYVSVRERKTK